MKVLLLNTTILTGGAGEYHLLPLSVENAKGLIARDGYESAIGHQATADILSILLETPIAVNRVAAKQLPRQMAIVFKLRGRLEEGKILTSVEELEAIGYDLFCLTYRVD
jgi:hypothetical protein